MALVEISEERICVAGTNWGGPFWTQACLYTVLWSYTPGVLPLGELSRLRRCPLATEDKLNYHRLCYDDLPRLSGERPPLDGGSVPRQRVLYRDSLRRL